MWERGLKHILMAEEHAQNSVAPHVGAWIETCLIQCMRSKALVAPHVGAWIETAKIRLDEEQARSLPMWERGLKQYDN